MGSGRSSETNLFNTKVPSTWKVWYVNPCDTRLECKFSLCQECLFEWVQVRINKDLLKGEVTIPWPQAEWNHSISLKDMQRSFGRSTMEKVLDKYLNVYMCNQYDIRKCPNTDWNNAGVITPKPCHQFLQWEWCHYKWKDITQYTLKDKIQRAIMGKYSLNSELLSYFSEIIRGEPCPEWGIIIFKTGGWPHMICQKCSFEFCWDCLGYYRDYQHMGDTKCPLRVFMMYPLSLFFLFALNFKVCYTYSLAANIEKSILSFLFCFVISTLILSSAGLEVFFVEKMKRFKRFRPNYRGKEYKFIAVMIFLYPLVWLFLVTTWYYIPELHRFIVFMMYEILVIFSLGGIFALLYVIYKTGAWLLKFWLQNSSSLKLVVLLPIMFFSFLILWRRDYKKLK